MTVYKEDGDGAGSGHEAEHSVGYGVGVGEGIGNGRSLERRQRLVWSWNCPIPMSGLILYPVSFYVRSHSKYHAQSYTKSYLQLVPSPMPIPRPLIHSPSHIPSPATSPCPSCIILLKKLKKLVFDRVNRVRGNLYIFFFVFICNSITFHLITRNFGFFLLTLFNLQSVPLHYAQSIPCIRWLAANTRVSHFLWAAYNNQLIGLRR